MTGPATRTPNTEDSVYGDLDGTVAFLDAPEGIIPPPYIGRLIYLGSVYDVVTIAVNRLREEHAAPGRKPSAQRALADLLGERSQQVVSRWVNAQSAPRLTDEQWTKLILLVVQAPLAKEALELAELALPVAMECWPEG